jgi:hypothetical protein
MKLCIRDTPGVNDTFMMREQITIRAIRDSRICVVVLSAHQALSSVDMALIRLISNIRAREVIIFVNRIDELSDPANQVPRSATASARRCKRHDGPADAEIVFGSAHWANLALTGRLDSIDADSAAALLNWAEAELRPGRTRTSSRPMSGGCRASRRSTARSGTRIAEGLGRETLARAARQAMNLAQGVEAAQEGAGRAAALPPEGARAEIERRIDGIARESLQASNRRSTPRSRPTTSGSTARTAAFSNARPPRSSIISTSTAKPRSGVTSRRASGFSSGRPIRSSAPRRRARRGGSSKPIGGDRITALYAESFDGLGADFAIAAPPTAHVPAPVVIGQTIALDIQGNWWRNWWRRRRGYAAYATEFYAMIEAETDPIVSDLKVVQSEPSGRDADDP